MGNEPFIYDQETNTLSLQNMPSTITAGFSVRKGGESHPPYENANQGLHTGDNLENVRQNRGRLAQSLSISLEQTVFAEQVHGGLITKVGAVDTGRGASDLRTAIKDVDGLYTEAKNVWLMSLYADCVPLYFYTKTKAKPLVGIAHAGWKGTSANIGANMVHMWEAREHVKPEEIEVVIGPSIGFSAYEVKEHIIQALKGQLPKGRKPWKSKSNGRYDLDLKEANALLIQNAGVPRERIAMSEHCTYSDRELFFSHRRDGARTGRMAAFIGINGRE